MLWFFFLDPQTTLHYTACHNHIEAISKGPPLKVEFDGSSSYAGKVFWPNLFVGASFQILEILTVFLRFKAHTEDRIRRVIPKRGETRPRLDNEPKSYF
jgi:hypothetical protein